MHLRSGFCIALTVTETQPDCSWHNSLPPDIQSPNFRMSISCGPLVHTLWLRLHLTRKADTVSTLTSVHRKCKHWHIGKYQHKRQVQEFVNLLLASSTARLALVLWHLHVIIHKNLLIIWSSEKEGLQKKKKGAWKQVPCYVFGADFHAEESISKQTSSIAMSEVEKMR